MDVVALHQHAEAAGFMAQLVQPSRRSQHSAYTALYEAVAGGFLHIPKSCEVLLEELSIVEVDSSTTPPTFGSPDKSRFKDDSVDALALAVEPLKRRPINKWAML